MEFEVEKRARILVNKARMGDLTDQEEEWLKRAMMGMAPSDSLYRDVSSALGSSTGPGYVEDAGEEGDFDIFSGLGSIAGAVRDEFMDPFGGNPENRDQGQYAGLPLSPTPERVDPGDDWATATSGKTGEDTFTGKMPLQDWLPGGGGLAANSMHGYGRMESDYGMTAEEVMDKVPQGYSFSDSNAMGLENLAAIPELFAREYSQDKGGGTNMSVFTTPYAQSALGLASTGAIGGGTGRNDLGGGPKSQPEKLKVAEEFMDASLGQGNFVNPRVIYGEMFDRANNTNWEQQTGETGEPYTPEKIIEVTNNALRQSLPYMSKEADAWMTSALNNAAAEYMLAIGKGETMSYPAFLQSLGIDKLL